MNWLWICATFAVAYLVGSVPFGLVAGLLRGVDIRQHGSKNIGATNAGRVLGRPWFFIVLTLDALKGAGCALAGHFLAREGADLALVGGVGAIFGHFFSIYLRLKGGKGVAAGLGVVLVLAHPPQTLVPYPAFVALGAFALTLAATRWVSAASIAAAFALPIAYGAWLGVAIGDSFYLTRLVFFGLLALAVIIKHRGNIRRILAGTEPRLGESKPLAPPETGEA
jgi:glycerol-3-phosphate acyltransferase PlsY